MRRFLVCAVVLGLFGGTAFAAGPIHRDAPVPASDLNAYGLPWDGHTVVLDPRTHEVTAQLTSVPLIMQSLAEKIVDYIRGKGLFFMANTQAHTRTMMRKQIVRFVEGAFGLVCYGKRCDVPAWARELRLALTLHGMHWSGRVFLDYERMLEVLRFVASRIEGRRVLAYLPGWEGRYYWQYGEWRPEPRLGGEAGFAALCRGAAELGVHLMPMFGGNCVNARLQRFRGLEASAHMKSATGNRFHGNQPDWDFARAHDTGWQGNPPQMRSTGSTSLQSISLISP